MLLVVFFSFSSNCRADASPVSFLGSATPTAFACSRSPVGAGAVALQGIAAVDGFDCITADDAEEEPLLAKGNPTRLPGGPEQTPGVSADRAHVSPRFDQETPQTTTTILDPIVLRQPGIIPAFLLPTDLSDSLRDNLRERAPPSLT